MEQQLLDSLENSLEVGGEIIAMFGGEHCLIIDCLLDIGHHIVNILRSRELALLASIIQPHVDSGT